MPYANLRLAKGNAQCTLQRLALVLKKPCGKRLQLAHKKRNAEH